eukprot:414941-Pyramimonas_sp.AAC.1
MKPNRLISNSAPLLSRCRRARSGKHVRSQFVRGARASAAERCPKQLALALAEGTDQTGLEFLRRSAEGCLGISPVGAANPSADSSPEDDAERIDDSDDVPEG